MPKQTRGFWVCDFCGLTFDRSLDAHVHEEHCAQRDMAPQETAAMAPYEPRTAPLLESHVLDHGLATADAVACRNLELFDSYEQVGLRCRLCARANARLSNSELSMPRSLASLPDAVRRMADRHLRVCEWMPVHERTALEQMMREGNWHDEDANRRALEDYCKTRCFQLGIVNRYPENSGLGWADPASQHHAPSLQQSPIRQPDMPAAAPSFDGRTMPLHGTPTRSHSQSESFEQQQQPQQQHARFPPSYQEEISPMQPPLEADAQAIFRNTSFELPSNFPFFQDPYDGDWLCKYCSHVHPQYRDAHYRWSTQDRTPPPGDFIDHHLAICRMYHGEQQQQQMQDYYQQPPPQYAYGAPPPPPDINYEAANYARVPPAAAAAVSTGPPPMPPHPSYSYELPPPPSYSPQRQHYTHHTQQQQQQQHRPESQEGAMMEEAARAAAHYLASHDRFAQVPDEENLVREEDKLLLTDFLYHLMKQLQVVRFSEADRKTRGGKRENINVGYGGLECIHCADGNKSRKFYWSGVDRLANSFAEIPSHVFKCKDCPDAIKNALTTLKEIHPEQMARLPRGSQKVFFRRVWKRIHEDDPEPQDTSPKAAAAAAASRVVVDTSSNPVSPTEDTKQTSPTNTTGTIGSEESVFVMERPTKEAAQALADLAQQMTPPSPSSRVLLAITEDRDFLSDQDCFIRKQLEVFCATADDVRMAQEDLKYPIQPGQVGIRCIHCSIKGCARGSGVVYPYSVSGIFEAVREFQRVHLEACEHFPSSWKSKLDNKESATISSIQRKYYTLAAKGLGLQDTRQGIRAGAESVPVVSQAVFTFADKDEGSWSRLYDEPGGTVYEQQQHLGTKRTAGEDHYYGDEPDSKRPALDYPR